MKLRELLDRMKPLFTGEATPAETATAIYGDAAGEQSGQRLVIYDRVRSERPRELAAAFPVTALQLGEAFDAVAYEYFVLHPWGAADYRPDGEGFADFLARDPRPWLGELARLEWAVFCARQTSPRPRETSDRLRLGGSTRVLRFAYDVARWLRTVTDRPPAPPERDSHVVVWTRESGEAHFLGLDDHQRAVLEQVAAGELDVEAIPGSIGATEHVVHGFVVAGIFVGPVPEDTQQVPTLGSELAASYTLAPFAQVRWEDGAMQLWSPLCTDVLASGDVDLVLVASQFAEASSLGDAVTGLADRMKPADVVEIADALWEAQLLVRADAPAHAAIRAGWDPHEVVAYAIARDPARRIDPAPLDDGARVAVPSSIASVLHAVPTRLARCDLVVQLAAELDGTPAGVYRYDPETQDLVTLGGSSGYPAPCVIEVGGRVARSFAAGGTLLSLHVDAGRVSRDLELAAAANGRHARTIDVMPADDVWSRLVLAAFQLW